MNLTYENFIRFAFEVALNRDVARWGDPAQLANTDVFAVGELPEIKAAVSYSMCILNCHIREFHREHAIIQNQQNYDRLDTIVADVINAPDKTTVYNLIVEYRETFFPIIPTPEYRA